MKWLCPVCICTLIFACTTAIAQQDSTMMIVHHILNNPKKYLIVFDGFPEEKMSLQIRKKDTIIKFGKHLLSLKKISQVKVVKYTLGCRGSIEDVAIFESKKYIQEKSLNYKKTSLEQNDTTPKKKVGKPLILLTLNKKSYEYTGDVAHIIPELVESITILGNMISITLKQGLPPLCNTENLKKI